jgi:branched-chain amino acid transport system permease protein
MAAEALVAQLILNGLVAGSVYTLIGSGMTLILGVMGVINVAHGAFYMLGGYVAVVASAALGLHPLFAVAIAVGAMFLVGAATQRIAVEPIRTSVDAVLIVTFGIAYLLEGVALTAFGAAFAAGPPIVPGNFSGFGLYVLAQQAIAAVSSLGIIGLLWRFLSKTKTGKAIRAVSDDREVAMILGVNVTRSSMISFGVGVALVGAAGSLLASVYPVYPSSGWKALLTAFVVVVLGGMGSLKGSVVAGLLYGLIESFTEFLLPRFTIVTVLTVLIVIILVRPSGLFGKRIERV